MSKLAFAVVGAKVEPYAASPALSLRIRITESSGVQIHAIGLRVQVRIEPQLRRYSTFETPRLVELFGTPDRYAVTVRPMLWAHVSHMVLGFNGETEIDLSIPCSYDFEVAAHKYLSALDDGEIPLNVLFSGAVFVKSESGVSSELVPWDCEGRYRLPVAVWREAMDAFFPNSTWIRMSREVYDELYRFKTSQGLPTWDATLERLCERAKAER